MASSPPPLHHHQISTTAVADDDSTTTSTITPWRCETNWTVSGGFLDTAVTFESFDFPVDSESKSPKQPLLLVPLSLSDLEPCEITINFTQKHEIRQVYVRSTARVYEIYYALALQSENEYLCTVRCSAASVEDNLFRATDVKEAVCVSLEGPNEIVRKGRMASENNIGTNEDDWVEIKLPVGRVDEGNTYLANQASNNIRNYQDYHEATAEINDSEPCMSLTLRLLSLQSKGCVYVDEVYVFADPIDTNESENQIANAESSAGSTLMTMLVPTLLGLTKSRSVQLHDQHNSKSIGKPIETESGPATLTNPVNLTDQQDEELPKQSKVKAELSRFQVPASAPDKDKACDSTMRNAFSYNQAENILEQLVSRVTRIEDICLRFEENMLKPINSLEARLQRVEQQVDLLAKNSQCPVLPSCPRFEPNVRSISNARNNSRLSTDSESEKKESGSDETHKPPEGTFLAVSTQIHQGLMATDPESPYGDEKEEVNYVLESPKKEIPKKSVSIDDALAAALAGFSSLTEDNNSLAFVPLEFSEECLKHNQAPIDTTLGPDSKDEASVILESLKATAPEFTGEEATQSSESLKVTACGFRSEEIDGDNRIISPTPKSSVVDVLDCAGDSTITSHDAYTEIPDDSFRVQGTSEVADEEAMAPTASISCQLPHENDTSKSDAQLVKQNSIRMVKIVNFNKADIFKHFPDPSPNASDTIRVSNSPYAEDVTDGTESTVDFESPILEVKFVSLGNSSLKSPLEALLSYTDNPATDESVAITQHSNVCNVEEKTTSANNLLVELDGACVGEGVQQDLPPVHQETTFASLI